MTLKRIVLAFALILSLATVFAQEKVHEYSYLVDAANKVFDIQLRSVDLNAGQLHEITTISCISLRRLQKDPNFPEDLDKLARQLRDYQNSHRALRDDLTKFMDVFLLPEIAALESAGLSDDAIAHISAAIGYVHGALGEKTDPILIRNAIEGLTKEVCDANAKLERERQDEQNSRELRGMAIRWSMGIGGVVVLAVDAGSTAPTGGAAAASLSIGGALLIPWIDELAEPE
jgi:hypothetical protein